MKSLHPATPQPTPLFAVLTFGPRLKYDRVPTRFHEETSYYDEVEWDFGEYQRYRITVQV